MKKYIINAAELSHMEHSKIPFAIYQFLDRRVVTLTLSEGFLDVFGYTDLEKAYYDMDNDMYKDTHPDDTARIAEAAIQFAINGGKYDVIYRTRDHKHGGYKVIHAQGEHFLADEGVQLAQVWYIDEGTYDENTPAGSILNFSAKAALYQESFIKATSYDHLTGLPSMTYFFELATIKRSLIESEGFRPALLFMDFSGMKYYNHKYGFTEGDRLLQSFSRLLADFFGNENCCRIGQDHFAAITKEEDLEPTLKELFDECCGLNSERSLPLHVGIYLNWYEGIVASMACDRAKFACDTLRSVYSSEFSYYNSTMKDAEEKQQYIIANLDRAIEERWIKVYYQPIIRAVTGRVCDEEALARWIDPIRGFMSPGEFIPVLEDHRLIYKLDLFVVDLVLEKINTLKNAGLHLMPQSINLSRSDFDTCDIVEEICKRCDTAGISHDMLTIEITESTVGKDFDFMKKQIERFRERGFAVWMDDFGSGYSSLDVLQSIKFDLIKFDMRFMQQFESNTSSRIILAEMLRMATSLGTDTVCEGVETAEQVQFLQETGCSKLQGYYYQKPIPVDKILEKYATGAQIGFENPAEQRYNEAVGRVNLHDLSIIAQGDNNSFETFFNTLPMAVIEVTTDGLVRFARSNQSYRDFMLRYFNFPINNKLEEFGHDTLPKESPFMKGLLESRSDQKNLFIDEHLSNTITVHSCLRRLAVNPVTGTAATAVAVLSITDANRGTTYAHIAKALAADYFNLFYVDLETEKFIEYTSKRGKEELDIERHGENFFTQARDDALKYVCRESIDSFLEAFTKENIIKELDEQGNFTITYRLMIGDEPNYVSMKVMRMQHDPAHIIIAISNIDSQMKEKIMLENTRRTTMTFKRLMALSGDYICIYTVDPVTGSYLQFSANDAYKSLGLAWSGSDFFGEAKKNSLAVIYEEDRQFLIDTFTKENVTETIGRDGYFIMKYRVLMPNGIVSTLLRAAMISEEDGDKLIIGISYEEAPVKQNRT